jgi:broad specificity phosphatase PhoE
MATEVFLIRHGQTDANAADYYMGWSAHDLNELGRHQAYCLSSRLADLPITAIYTSPLRRTVATASIIAEPHRVEVRPLPDVIEIQLGEWQGMYRDDIKHKWPGLWRQFNTNPSEFRFPGGESYSELTERSVRALKMVSKAHRGEQIAIISHDAVIRVLVAYILGVSNLIYRRLEINNASLSLLRISAHATLVKLNDTSHLETSGCIAEMGGLL